MNELKRGQILRIDGVFYMVMGVDGEICFLSELFVRNKSLAKLHHIQYLPPDAAFSESADVEFLNRMKLAEIIRGELSEELNDAKESGVIRLLNWYGLLNKDMVDKFLLARGAEGEIKTN